VLKVIEQPRQGHLPPTSPTLELVHVPQQGHRGSLSIPSWRKQENGVRNQQARRMTRWRLSSHCKPPDSIKTTWAKWTYASNAVDTSSKNRSANSMPFTWSSEVHVLLVARSDGDGCASRRSVPTYCAVGANAWRVPGQAQAHARYISNGARIAFSFMKKKTAL